MKLEILLIAAGLGHFGILIASFLVPFALDWKKHLTLLPRFLRMLFWVYGAFIVLTIAAFGTLTLLHAREMAAGEPVARSLAVFIAIFWGIRCVMQWTHYSAEHWRGKSDRTVIHWIVFLSYAAFSATYLKAALG